MDEGVNIFGRVITYHSLHSPTPMEYSLGSTAVEGWILNRKETHSLEALKSTEWAQDQVKLEPGVQRNRFQWKFIFLLSQSMNQVDFLIGLVYQELLALMP